jgi:hypothetical protein
MQGQEQKQIPANDKQKGKDENTMPGAEAPDFLEGSFVGLKPHATPEDQATAKYGSEKPTPRVGRGVGFGGKSDRLG